MTMTRCRECGEGVSSEAAACPHCGVREPAVMGADPRPVDHPPHAAAAHPVADRDIRGARVGRGWRTMTLLLVLLLVSLFALWYSGILSFT